MLPAMSARHPAVSARIRQEVGHPPPRGAVGRLADALGTQASTVSRWLSLQSSPDPALWPFIEHELDLDPGTLASEAGSDNVIMIPPSQAVLDAMREQGTHDPAGLVDMISSVARARTVDDPRQHIITWDLTSEGTPHVHLAAITTQRDDEILRLRREVDALKQAVEVLLVGGKQGAAELLESIRSAGTSGSTRPSTG